MSLRQLSARKI